MHSPFEVADRAAEQLRTATGVDRHHAVVVLGTGLSKTAGLLGATGRPVDLTDLAGFVTPTVSGHRPHAWSLELAKQRVLVVGGRVHLYEGRTPDEVVHLVRTAVAAGCTTVALTCAAGGLAPQQRPGDLVLIADHLNLTGRSPLTGVLAEHPLPSPFVDLTQAWSLRLRRAVTDVHREVSEGVYAQLPGPHFETPAEIAMLRHLGADLVGMSTVLEAIAARHLGAEVLGVAVVTNAAAGLDDRPISVEQIRGAADTAPPRLAAVLTTALAA